ncbi:DNA sulfur modification protein DndD, partial [Nostoc sp. NIES-2111]
LAEQETPPQIVIEAIRGLLGLELADKLTVDLEILVNRKRKELADAKDLAELEEIEQKLSQQQADYQILEEKLAIFKNQIEELEIIQREALDKFVSEGGKIASDRHQLELQQKEKNHAAETIRQSMCQLAAEALPLALIPNLLSQVQAQGAKEFRYQQVQLARDVLIERDKRLLQWLKQLTIASEQVEKIESFLTEDADNLYTGYSQGEVPWLLADEESLSQLDNIRYHLQNAKVSAKQQLANLKILEEELIVLARQVQTAAEPEAYQKLRETMEEAQNQVVQAKANYETTRRSLAELAEIIEKTKTELGE